MKNYISTYFFQDLEDLGAEYGNIFSDFEQRNLIYWKTVFVFFSSSIIVNRTFNIHYIFFTNVDDFPYKRELEALGVKIVSGLRLTNRNVSSWATVKFFFDVLNYITISDDFSDEDNFVLLDTDVICIGNSHSLFKKIGSLTKPLVYSIGVQKKKYIFHGVGIKELEKIYLDLLKEDINVSYLIGGEFFGISKFVLKKYCHDFNALSSITRISTEEQVLTLSHAAHGFSITKFEICRIWTTLKKLTIPINWQDYTFLHLPSEKSTGLIQIFNFLYVNDLENLDRNDIIAEIKFRLNLSNVFLLYYKLIARKILGIIKIII